MANRTFTWTIHVVLSGNLGGKTWQEVLGNSIKSGGFYSGFGELIKFAGNSNNFQRIELRELKLGRLDHVRGNYQDVLILG